MTKKKPIQKQSEYIEDETETEETTVEQEEDTEDVEETQELEFGDNAYGRIGDFGCSEEWD